METLIGVEDSPVELLHEIGGRLATADGFHEVLDRVVEFASGLVKCDSCLIYGSRARTWSCGPPKMRIPTWSAG